MAYSTSESEEDEVVYIRISEPEEPACRVALRSGTCIPERQPPRDSDKEMPKSASKSKEPAEQGETSKVKKTVGDYNVLAQLRRVPASLSILDALMMSSDSRDALIYALQNP